MYIDVCVLPIDIQEFYESILLNDDYDRPAKATAIDNLANQWANQPMLNQNVRVRRIAFFDRLLF